MRDAVTLPALRELGQYLIRMRLRMAPRAKRDLTVAGMTVGTRYGRVFCHLLLEHVGDIPVTAGADHRIRRFSVDHLPRFVDRVTAHAVF